jgi:hypothetical protein
MTPEQKRAVNESRRREREVLTEELRVWLDTQLDSLEKKK